MEPQVIKLTGTDPDLLLLKCGEQASVNDLMFVITRTDAHFSPDLPPWFEVEVTVFLHSYYTPVPLDLMMYLRSTDGQQRVKGLFHG